MASEALTELIRQTAQSEPDINEGVNLVMSEIEGDPEYQPDYDAVMRSYIRQAYSAARHSMRTCTKIGFRNVDIRVLENMSNERAKTIFDEWISGSKRFGDMTKAELLADAQTCRNRADGHLKNSRFQEQVAMLMKDDDRTVRQQLKLKQVEKIKQEVYETKSSEGHSDSEIHDRFSNAGKSKSNGDATLMEKPSTPLQPVRTNKRSKAIVSATPSVNMPAAV